VNVKFLIFGLVVIIVSTARPSRAEDIDREIVNNLDFFMNLNLIQTKEMLELVKVPSDQSGQNSARTVSGDLNHENK
jgi:hypothetical protein